MIRIAITPAAYAAIAGMLPGDVGVERARAENGDICIWLDPGLLAKLKTQRGPGESYSDVMILRRAKGDGERAGNKGRACRPSGRWKRGKIQVRLPMRRPSDHLTRTTMLT
jgi:hypothetical protein